jgi:hypothetical protein
MPDVHHQRRPKNPDRQSATRDQLLLNLDDGAVLHYGPLIGHDPMCMTTIPSFLVLFASP